MAVKAIKRLILIVLIMVVAVIGINVFCMYSYLKLYGFGLKELPGTTFVFLNLSKGFTVSVDEDSDISTFIGRHDYIYDEMLEDNGYYLSDQMGEARFYSKKGDVKEEDDMSHEFSLLAKNDWCFWFRVYRINNGYKIEDFK